MLNLNTDDPLIQLFVRSLAGEVAAILKDSLKDEISELVRVQKKLIELGQRTGEIRQTDLKKEFRLSSDTLKAWEEHGLNRRQRGGSAFYILSELHNFEYNLKEK